MGFLAKGSRIQRHYSIHQEFLVVVDHVDCGCSTDGPMGRQWATHIKARGDLWQIPRMIET